MPQKFKLYACFPQRHAVSVSRATIALLSCVCTCTCTGTWNSGGVGVDSAHASGVGIWHGHPVSEGQFPFVAALLHNGTQFCAGSLIHSSAILTAAHCVDDQNGISPFHKRQRPTTFFPLRASSSNTRGNIRNNSDGAVGFEMCDVEIVVNVTNLATLESDNGSSIIRRVRSVHIQPSYNITASSDFDVAVILLNESVPAHVSPITMISNGTKDLEMASTKVAVVGWGQTEKSTNISVANYANLTIVNMTQCQALFPPPEWCCPWPKLSPNMVCTYDFSGRNASDCDGDSGGPMFAVDGNNNNEYVLVGTVSWGTLCGGPPDIYQRVLRWRTWIDGVITQHLT